MGDELGAANSEHSLALVLLSQGRAEEARALLAKILGSTEQLGERRARAHHLDSLAMVDMVDGDQRSAQRHLADAAAIAAEVDNPSLRASVSIHRALALLASGDLAAAAVAAGDCAQQVAGAAPDCTWPSASSTPRWPPAWRWPRGDRAAAAACAADMASRAAKAEDVRYGEAAQRISAVITSAADGRSLPGHASPAALGLRRRVNGLPGTSGGRRTACRALPAAGKCRWQERSNRLGPACVTRGVATAQRKDSPMLVHATEALSCAWAILIAAIALCTRGWRPAPGRASLTPAT